jgi:hypothetical protein
MRAKELATLIKNLSNADISCTSKNIYDNQYPGTNKINILARIIQRICHIIPTC